MTDKDEINEPEENCLSDLIDLSQQRAKTYGMLSRMFIKEIDKTFLEELQKARFPMKTGSEKIDKGYRLLAEYLSSAWENSLTDLAIDYVRVFIGYGMDSYCAAFPYESVYTSKDRLVMQEARDQVLAIYRTMGLDKQESWHDGEDHVALELEFMQIMSNRTVVALEAGDEEEAIRLLEIQKDFLKCHLGLWAPFMMKDMRKFAKTDFYSGISYLTEGFLAVDGEVLSELLGVEEEEQA